MDPATTPSHYLDTLLEYFEEEIMGEAYFYGLVEHFKKDHEREKLVLLAQIERRAVEIAWPLIEKYGLVPRSASQLKPQSDIWIEQRHHLNWDELVLEMSIRYPTYVDQFRALEKIAPQEDLQALTRLTDHEVVLIEFANKEIERHPNSLEPVRRYLEQA